MDLLKSENSKRRVESYPVFLCHLSGPYGGVGLVTLSLSAPPISYFAQHGLFGCPGYSSDVQDKLSCMIQDREAVVCQIKAFSVIVIVHRRQ